MLVAREELSLAQAMLASLKGFDSSAAELRRTQLNGHIKNLSHWINALRAPKDRLPGLRKAVKVREAALQQAMDAHCQALHVQKAQAKATAAVENVAVARTELPDIGS